MKLIRNAVILSVAVFLFAGPTMAQDINETDTLRLEVTNGDWVIGSVADSLYTLEVWGWMDDQLIGGCSFGFRMSFDFNTFDTTRWNGYLGTLGDGREFWFGRVDSMIAIDTFIFDPGITAQSKLYSRSLLIDENGTPSDLDWGYNGFSVGLINVFPPGPVLTPGTPTKIGELTLWLNTSIAEASPVDFNIDIDSAYFPPAGAFKYSPTGGTGFAPYFEKATIHVTNTHSIAEDQIDEEIVPRFWELSQNFPNPFNPSTTLRYHVKNKGMVNLTVYNILGQQVKTLVNAEQDAGWQEAVWDGHDEYGNEVASGIYFYKMEASEFVETKKMLLMK